MALSSDDKKKIIAKFAVKKGDTGSPEVQVALLSVKIQKLTVHLKTHKKDTHSRRGLLSMVAKRRRLLNYLAGKDAKRHKELEKNLKLIGDKDSDSELKVKKESKKKVKKATVKKAKKENTKKPKVKKSKAPPKADSPLAKKNKTVKKEEKSVKTAKKPNKGKKTSSKTSTKSGKK
jgi:small subunit ribosomal protein S15